MVHPIDLTAKIVIMLSSRIATIADKYYIPHYRDHAVSVRKMRVEERVKFLGLARFTFECGGMSRDILIRSSSSLDEDIFISQISQVHQMSTLNLWESMASSYPTIFASPRIYESGHWPRLPRSELLCIYS